MSHTVEIENIEKMRSQAGIEDDELREDICRLQVGDYVKLTLLTDNDRLRSETILVRITSMPNGAYRGKLAETPETLGDSTIRAGSFVTFNKDHIHSIPKQHTRHKSGTQQRGY